jgi:hypothetical protein
VIKVITPVIWLSCLFLPLAIASCNNAPQPKLSVVGKWAEQTGAAWEFTADGKVIIKDNSEATYTLTGDKALSIEFHDAQHFEVDYTIELSATKLVLHPQNAHGDGALPQDWDESTVLVKSS